MPFLTAQWTNLVFLNYEVDPALLTPLLPKGLELDEHEGQHFVSLVAFQFLNTRVFGVKWPSLRSFTELNLRFYVRRKMPDGEIRRGVVFIKELVPSSIIAYVARTVYHEPYERWDIRHSNDSESRYEYTWSKGESKNSLGVLIEANEHDLGEGSHEEFIMEHYWGYRLRTNDTAEYEVKHPAWSYHVISNLEIDCDFSAVYGDKFDFLSRMQPDSRFFSWGSDIAVYSKSRFKLQVS